MAHHRCRFTTSFVFLLLSFILLCVSAARNGWFWDASGASYYYDGTSPDTSRSFSYNSSSVMGCLATAITFTIIALILCTILMVVDNLDRLNEKLLLLPKFIITLTTFAGFLCELSCILFLAYFYNSTSYHLYQSSTYTNYLAYSAKNYYTIPSYSFYIVIVVGIFLMVTSCINCCIRLPNAVEDAGIKITVAQSQEQQQTMSAVYPYPGYPAGLPGQMPTVYPVAQAVPPYAAYPAAPAISTISTGVPMPAPTYQASYSDGKGNVPAKIFVTHMFSQTSETDLKMAAKKY